MKGVSSFLMYSEDTDIYGVSIGKNNEPSEIINKDILPPLARIDFTADSISYLASKNYYWNDFKFFKYFIN